MTAKWKQRRSRIISIFFLEVILLLAGCHHTSQNDQMKDSQSLIYEVTPKIDDTFLHLIDQHNLVIEYANVNNPQKDYNDQQIPLSVSYVFGRYHRENGKLKITKFKSGIDIYFADKKTYANNHAYKIRSLIPHELKNLPENSLVIQQKGRTPILSEKNGDFNLKKVRKKLPSTLNEAKTVFQVDSRYKPKRYVNDGSND